MSSASRLRAYSVLKRIGKGSYGEVYLVAAVGDAKKQYVMKSINLTGSSAKERLGAEQEAALLSHLHHPNIVSYKESFQDDSGVLHIVMGYCEGGDLHSRLKTYGNSYLPETKVVEWFVQIALGLQYLHDRNILHRDLKTQNIFLSKNDIIKVGDLGIARVLDGSCDLAHTVIGTPYYMSPELFANQPYNHKSDIWALGCCVHEIASLRHAFSARNINALMYKVIQGKAPPIPPHYSKELVQVVQQMLAQKAETRPDVHQILRKAFIRRHIQIFLDRASGRKRKGKPPLSSKPAPREDAGEHKEILKQAKIIPKEPMQSEDVVPVLSPLPPHTSFKVPRPLPPDPSSDQSSNEVVSSARQRRRKSKLQQEGCRKITPRPSFTDSANTAVSEEGNQQESRVCTNQHTGGANSGNSGDFEQTDGAGGRNGDDAEWSTAGDVKQSVADASGQDHEVEDFYTLLDSTLQLSEVEASQQQPSYNVGDGSGARRTPEQDDGKGQLPSGRLAERIKALRTECEVVLGTAVVNRVMELLNGADPEESQEDIKLVLGTDIFEVYAAKLQQLKLCQDSLFFLS